MILLDYEEKLILRGIYRQISQTQLVPLEEKKRNIKFFFKKITGNFKFIFYLVINLKTGLLKFKLLQITSLV